MSCWVKRFGIEGVGVVLCTCSPDHGATIMSWQVDGKLQN